MNARFALLALAGIVIFGDCAAGPEEEWIAKARAFLGKEGDLNAVQCVRFSGVLETVEKVPSEADASVIVDRPIRVAVEIVFQKQDRQIITLHLPNVVETTALDGYDGWRRRRDTLNSANWQLTLLNPQQVKRLRANTWENLSFFKGIEKRGGRVELIGDSAVDGRGCVALAFIHSDDIVFTRHFDKSTGQLLKTVTENGSEIREDGRIMVSGIRFPKTVINREPGGHSTTITFDSVTLNEPVPESAFAVPAMVQR
jgi:hypothetical protein